MAYGGKPSRGCQMCRIRRIKCDETKPGCNQCARARRQCPGYRQPFPAAAATDKRAKGARAGGNPLAPRTAGPSGDAAAPPPREAVPALLQLPLLELASCHFISNYVLIPRQCLTTTRGFLEFLLPLLKKEAPAAAFKHAFDACALASINNRVASGNDFEGQALGCYTKALAATFRALRDPAAVRRDDTLAAILLLGLFESITAKSLGMFAWSSHIEGAIELVKARGPEQLKTKTGLDLFVAVRTQMIIHALSTGKAPDLCVEWWIDDPVSEDYSSEFQIFSSRTGLLRDEVNHSLASLARTPETIRSMRELMHRCQAFDQEIVDWLQGLPPALHLTTVAWEDYNPKRDYSKADAFPGRVDIYGDLWVANMWNVMRCMRIVLASLVTRITAWSIWPADYRTTPEYAAVSRTCGEAIADVIASVPYQLGLFARRRDVGLLGAGARPPPSPSLPGFACGHDDTDKSLAGFFAIWPLVCVQSQDQLTDLQRVYVKGRLRCIGGQLGVRHASLLARQDLRVPSMLILRDRPRAAAGAGAASEPLAAGGEAVPAPAAVPAQGLLRLGAAAAAPERGAEPGGTAQGVGGGEVGKGGRLDG